MSRYYLLGSLSNDPENIAKYEVAEQYLSDQGHQVCNPWKIDYQQVTDPVKQFQIRVSHMLSCDYLYKLPLWTELDGLDEHTIQVLGLKVELCPYHLFLSEEERHQIIDESIEDLLLVLLGNKEIQNLIYFHKFEPRLGPVLASIVQKNLSSMVVVLDELLGSVKAYESYVLSKLEEVRLSSNLYMVFTPADIVNLYQQVYQDHITRQKVE